MSMNPTDHPAGARPGRPAVVQTSPPGRPDWNPLRFAAGATYPFRAFGVILARPALWPYCAAPLLVNAAVATWVWFASAGWVAGLSSAGGGGGYGAAALHGLAVGAAFVLRALAVLVAIVAVGPLAALPFNDALSARVDSAATGWTPPGGKESVAAWARRTASAMAHELGRIAIYLSIIAVCFAFSFIPLLAPFAWIAKVAVTMAFLSLDHLSYCLDRRGHYRLPAKLGFLSAHPAACLGFGAGLLSIAIVPLVNFVFLPLGVAGGALLFADIERRTALRAAASDRP